MGGSWFCLPWHDKQDFGDYDDQEEQLLRNSDDQPSADHNDQHQQLSPVNFKKEVNIQLIYQYIDTLLERLNEDSETTMDSANAPEGWNGLMTNGETIVRRISSRMRCSLSKSCFMATLDSETRREIADVCQSVSPQAWYLNGAASVVLFVLGRMEKTRKNREECIDLIKYMHLLCKHLMKTKDHIDDSNTVMDIMKFLIKQALMWERMLQQNVCSRCMRVTIHMEDLQALRIELTHKYNVLCLDSLQNLVNNIPAITQASQEMDPSANRLICIEERLEAIKVILNLESKAVAEIVAVHGMGGMGKTALADSLYKKLDLKSYKHARLKLGENSIKEHQSHLLVHLFQRHFALVDCRDGRNKLQEMFKTTEIPVFIFIDNVSKEEELTDILPLNSLPNLPPGSKILITTQHINELGGFRFLKMPVKEYLVEALTQEQSIRVLRMYSTGDENRSFSYDRQLAMCCHGIPYFLQLIGNRIKGKFEDDIVCYDLFCEMDRCRQPGMQETSELYKNVTYTVVGSVLQKLSAESQDSFLDIVNFSEEFFSIANDKLLELRSVHSVDFYDTSQRCDDLFGKEIMQELKGSGLVRFQQNKVQIHSLAKQEAIRIGARSRLKLIQNSCNHKGQGEEHITLLNQKELISYRGFMGNAEQFAAHISASNGASMRLLVLENSDINIISCDLPNLRGLLILQTDDIGPIDKSQGIHWLGLCFEDVPQQGMLNFQFPKTLKWVVLNNKNEKSFELAFDVFRHLQGLKLLQLRNVKLGMPFIFPLSLRVIILDNCNVMKTFTVENGFHSLQLLQLSGCLDLESLEVKSAGLKEVIVINCTALKEVEIVDCGSLKRLVISLSPHLKDENLNLGKTPILEELNIRGCKRVTCLPLPCANSSSLETLDISHSGIVQLPEDLIYLRVFKAEGCHLQCSFYIRASNLQHVNVASCVVLQRFPFLSRVYNVLQKLDVSHCLQLRTLEDILRMPFLQSLYAVGCLELEGETMGHILRSSSLERAYIAGSPELVKSWEILQKSDPTVMIYDQFDRDDATALFTLLFSEANKLLWLDDDGDVKESIISNVVTFHASSSANHHEVKGPYMSDTEDQKDVSVAAFLDLNTDYHQQIDDHTWRAERKERAKKKLQDLTTIKYCISAPFQKTTSLIAREFYKMCGTPLSLTSEPHTKVVVILGIRINNRECNLGVRIESFF